MKRFMRLICVALVLAMAAGLAIGCGPAETGTSPGGAETGAGAGSGAGTGTPAGGGVVSDPDAFASRTIGVFSMLGRLYAGMSPPENHAASDGVFDVVFRPDLATGEVFSWILEDWRWEDEGTTLIMTMRDDIYFSNGAHATSRDLLYSYTSVPGRGAPTFAAFPIIWEETKVLDEFTMQMRFERPWPTIMRTIVYLINEEWSESVQWDDEAWLFPVGSGPYFVYQHIPDDRIVLRLRDEYWRTDISEYYIDEWIIRFIPDQSTLAMELELGNVHIAHLDSASYSRLLNHGAENVQPMLRSLGTTIYLNFGMVDAYPLWNDIRLREAIRLGVNWLELGEIFYGDRFIPTTSVATSQARYFVDLPPYEFDPDRARALLDEAGFGPGNPLVLNTTLMESDRVLAEAFQFYLSQIGITANIEFVDVATAIDIWRSQSGNDFAFWHAHRGSPFHELRAGILYANTTFHSFNFIDDEEFIEAFENMIYTFDEDEVDKNARIVQQLTYDRVLMIPFAEVPFNIGFRTDQFSEEQMNRYAVSATMHQTSRLGHISAWE